VQHIAVVDVGTGNLRSVEWALDRAAAEAAVECKVEITGSAEAIRHADKIVMPGQGAFRDCAAGLLSGIGDALNERIRTGTPYLGICLGLQALLQDSEEAPGAKGLGLFRGTVRRLANGAVDPSTGAPVKIPHMGWNRIEIVRRGAGPLAVFDDDPPYVYFVHSFHAVPEDSSLIAAVVEHGPYRITAAIQKDNVTATQFHPEKSQAAGLKLLIAFLME
jgi:glutamine amidotransferase